MRRATLCIGAILLFGSLRALPALAAQDDGGARSSVKTPLETALQKLQKESGAVVLADASLKNLRVSSPLSASTEMEVEEQLDLLIKQMPKGAVWAKLLIPPPVKGRSYTCEDLVHLLVAHSRLFNATGASRPGFIEIFGTSLASDKAQPVVSVLNLKPYYVVTVLGSESDDRAAGSESLLIQKLMNSVDQHVEELAKLDPKTRAQALRQYFKLTETIFNATVRRIPMREGKDLVQLVPQISPMTLGFGSSGG